MAVCKTHGNMHLVNHVFVVTLPEASSTAGSLQDAGSGGDFARDRKRKKDGLCLGIKAKSKSKKGADGKFVSAATAAAIAAAAAAHKSSVSTCKHAQVRAHARTARECRVYAENVRDGGWEVCACCCCGCGCGLSLLLLHSGSCFVGTQTRTSAHACTH